MRYVWNLCHVEKEQITSKVNKKFLPNKNYHLMSAYFVSY